MFFHLGKDLWIEIVLDLGNKEVFFQKGGMTIFGQNLVILAIVECTIDVPYGVSLSETPTNILHPWLCFLLIISYMLQLIDGRLLNQAVTNIFCPRVYFSQEQLFSKQSSPKVSNFFTKLRNCILLPKLFWPTVRKNCSSDWEELLNSRLKAENLQNFWDH